MSFPGQLSLRVSAQDSIVMSSYQGLSSFSLHSHGEKCDTCDTLKAIIY